MWGKIMKKIDFRIPIIVVLIVILTIMCIFYFKEDNGTISRNNNSGIVSKNDENSESTEVNTTIMQTTAEIKSALSENLSLHATYYFKEIYVTENQLVKEGENILQYTNGTYLVAPYDLIVTSINVPSENEQCTNSHYISVSANNVLQVQISVSESKINSISVGKDATIKIPALDNKEFEAVVTDVGNTASNGKFTVTIEFENDGNVYIGMTAEVTI